MSLQLTLQDAIADSLHYERLAHGWRLMAHEAIAALAAAHQREQSVREQLDLVRVELRQARGCAKEDSAATDDLATVAIGQ